MSASAILVSNEGRPFLYSFDFRKFRASAQETCRPVSAFQWYGVCWKFRYAGTLLIHISGELVANLEVDDGMVDSFALLTPRTIKPDDNIYVQVTDTQPRWFRWFRPNSAHVTLEGLECEP